MLPFWEILETQEEKEQVMLLYHCFKGLLYSIAFSMIQEKGKAEDIVQDTFIALMNNLDKLDDETFKVLEDYYKKKVINKSLSLKEYSKQTKNYGYVRALSYAITILKNKVYDLTNKTSKDNIIFVEEYFDDIIGSEEIAPEYMLLQDELLSSLKKAIKSLKYPYKDALYLRYYNNFSMEDICHTLNKNPDNVRKIISRARNMVKAILIKEGYCDQ